MRIFSTLVSVALCTGAGARKLPWNPLASVKICAARPGQLRFRKSRRGEERTNGAQRHHIHGARREQPIKQWPFPDKKVGATTKAKRHPQTRRFMFMREDHDRRNLHDGPVNPDRLETKDWAGVTRTMKKAALDMGAELVGVAPIDEFDYVRGTKAPEGHKVAISFAIHMDFVEMKRLGPLAQMEVHKVYYLLSDVSVRLAQYIRSYGYHAVGYPNEGDILFIPVAWKAGLGELGRHGSLITKKFGPSVRLGAVTTDMPLIPEAQPANYGFDDFCLRCNACTNLCPGDAIVPKKQDIFGTLRWHVDTPQCRPFFEQYEGCKICLTVCPINAQTHVAPMYKDLMKGLMRRKIPIRQLIDEWQTEGFQEAEEFGEGWIPEFEDDGSDDNK